LLKYYDFVPKLVLEIQNTHTQYDFKISFTKFNSDREHTGNLHIQHNNNNLQPSITFTDNLYSKDGLR